VFPEGNTDSHVTTHRATHDANKTGNVRITWHKGAFA